MCNGCFKALDIYCRLHSEGSAIQPWAYSRPIGGFAPEAKNGLQKSDALSMRSRRKIKIEKEWCPHTNRYLSHQSRPTRAAWWLKLFGRMRMEASKLGLYAASHCHLPPSFSHYLVWRLFATRPNKSTKQVGRKLLPESSLANASDQEASGQTPPDNRQ
ncbi:hypothetical protein BO86DRAFT_62144 [Aspergillus japonicus CBS 114.51]|uniref:Uncharacterized protein n=1 Tax=Aspergillus japonicus CBS 114.51 TaxID=1448312 RepID=A0A8T8X4T5_ASPJA|nr:hypothetical protein BO86DRAFT_62144 [Aspergillus japonicus CBS 114.51]RAH83133.1 hypothetical protein BO86DRAFT_62144 [Aspergillus japonicus CBS 114.51]